MPHLKNGEALSLFDQSHFKQASLASWKYPPKGPLRSLKRRNVETVEIYGARSGESQGS